MDILTILSLGQTALELGLICSLTVLALFLSYTMLNVCDLSTDGCFTLGAAVGAGVSVGAGALCLALHADRANSITITRASAMILFFISCFLFHSELYTRILYASCIRRLL